MRFAVVSSLFALASFASAALPAFPVAARDTLIVSPDGSCGNVGGVDFTCSGSGFGACCGAMGVCGSDPTSCSLASGCDPAFGDCNAAGASTATSSTVPPLTSTMPIQLNTTSTVGTPLLTSTGSASGAISPTLISTTSTTLTDSLGSRTGTQTIPTGTGASSGLSGTLLPTGLNTTMIGTGSAGLGSRTGTGLPTIISGATSTPSMTASPTLTSSGSGAIMPNIISTLPITNPDVVCYVYTSLVTMTMSA